MQNLLTARVCFGKFRGMLAKDIPEGYFEWLVNNVPKVATERWHSLANDVIRIYRASHDTISCLILNEIDIRGDIAFEEKADFLKLLHVFSQPVVSRLDKLRYADEVDARNNILADEQREMQRILVCAPKRDYHYTTKRILLCTPKRDYHYTAKSMERKLQDLKWLNEVLVATGNKIEKNITKAVHSIKTKVFLNIFDLEEGNYHKAFNNYADFYRDMKLRGMVFPLEVAKSYPHLRIFLH